MKKKDIFDLIHTKDSKIKCSHPIIFEGYNNLDGQFPCICALCGKEINDNKNNQHVVEIKPNYIYGNAYYSKLYIHYFIMNILKDKDDNEEIDFCEEFKRLFDNGELGEVKIDNKEYVKRYNILIIVGTNSIKISDNVYLRKEYDNSLNDIIQYFFYINRINLKILSSKGLRCNPMGYPLIEFQNFEELSKLLEQQKKIKFDLIIDATSLFTYNIENNNINILPYKLDLSSYFPNAKVLYLNNIRDEKELYEMLKVFLQSNNNSNDFIKLVLKS